MTSLLDFYGNNNARNLFLLVIMFQAERKRKLGLPPEDPAFPKPSIAPVGHKKWITGTPQLSCSDSSKMSTGKKCQAASQNLYCSQSLEGNHCRTQPGIKLKVSIWNDMDRSKEEIMANDVAANALPKTRECAISVGPSIGKSTSTSHKLPKGSTSASSGMLDSDDMNRNVTSMKGPQSHDDNVYWLQNGP
ncbi:hypothetical protein FXO38_28737 [Capsicum annuum]|nr:hypothetical protein FXO38_28737 [Capsicum annuum]